MIAERVEESKCWTARKGGRMERSDCEVVQGALEAALEARPLRACTCGQRDGQGARCAHCRLVEAVTALWKLRMRGLFQEKLLELYRNPGKRRAIARRRLDQAIARAIEQAPAGVQDSLGDVLGQLTGALAEGTARETLGTLVDAVAEVMEELEVAGVA